MLLLATPWSLILHPHSVLEVVKTKKKIKALYHNFIKYIYQNTKLSLEFL